VYRLLAAWMFLVSAIVGCGSEPSEDEGPAAARPLRLALNWFPEAEHGGFFAAQVHGYFRDQAVDVEILPGGPGVPVIQQVALGRVDFAVANADQVLLGRAQGAPVVAVMAAMQGSPRCIMVHADSKIDSLRQLRDMTLAVGSGKPFARYLLEQLGDHSLTIIPYQGNVTAFLQNKDVAQQAYVFSEPYVARQQGVEPKCLMLSDIGFNPYTSLLITSERTIADNPMLVQKMVRASIRGWREYLQSPGETNARIHALNEEMSEEILAFGARAIRPLCLPAGSDPESLGTMTLERWRELAQQLHSVGLLEDVSVWRKAFDRRFLPADLEPASDDGDEENGER